MTVRTVSYVFFLVSLGFTRTYGAQPGILTVQNHRISDARGIEIEESVKPKRIVSLNPGATELLFAAGAGRTVVGCTTYCDYPPEVRRLPKIGDVNTSVEKVLALKPDLVVAGLTSNRKAIAVLERLHLKVFVVEPTSITSIADTIELLGRVAGTEMSAGVAAKKFRSTISQIQSEADRQHNHPGVLWLVQSSPPIAVGGKNFMDDAIRLAGGKNPFAASGSGWISVTQEHILAAAPNVIITDRGTVETLKHKPLWSNVPAVRSGSVFALTSGESARPSPRIVEAVQQLAAFLRRARAKSP